MRPTLSRALPSLATVAAAALALAPVAAAHGTLSPAAAPGGVSQRFELTVPNSRLDADIDGISLELPSGAVLESAEAAQPRWAVTSSESSVRWTGGPIDRGGVETFAFTARLATESGPAEFVLLEHFDDGDGAPFPISVVVTGAAASGEGTDTTLVVVALLVAALATVTAAAAVAWALRLRRRLELLDTPESGV